MSLSPGTRIGIFEIVAKLGEGGMGEVYRARDTRLDRDVALKVLPAVFTSDAERVSRFSREAKVLASLNHPNIAHIYGFESTAIAMELVDGQTLAELLADHAAGLPLDRALAIVRQIAAALEAAHDQGIVHRDLKPANVKVREDGTVKVLDFGLAKAFASDADGSMSGVADSPTLTARHTQVGMILGTAAYMAPEQAKGRAVDRRADVWAFGVVFFEMLAGRRAFDGDDVSDVLASVLKMEPDWSALPGDLPPPVRRLLRRCLEKEPKRRLRDVGEGLLQLDEGLAAGSLSSAIMPAGMSGASTVAAALPPPLPFWRRALPVVAAVALTALAAFAWSRWAERPPAPAEPVRFSFLPTSASLAISNTRRDVSISPNGQMLAFIAQSSQNERSIFIRRLDQLEAAPLRGGEGALAPVFSPDSNWIAVVDYLDQSLVKRVSIQGGPAVPICKVPTTVYGIAWLADGRLVLGVQGSGLQIVSEAGGTPETLVPLDSAARESDHVWPAVIPGTSLVLFVVSSGGRTPMSGGKIAVMDVASKRVVRLGVTGSQPRYLPTGHIVYAVEDGSVRAMRFDRRTMAVSGNPVPVLDAVTVKPSGAAIFDVSDDGKLVYTTVGSVSGVRTLAWVDRSGKETPIGAPARPYFYARLSPDAKRLSLDVRDQNNDVWVWDLGRETMSRLTDSPGADQYGLWTRDGERIVYSAGLSTGRTELFWHRPDGLGKPEQLTDTSAEQLVPFPNAITPDGKQIIFRAAPAGSSKNDLFIVDVGGDKKARKLFGTEHDEKNAALSNDGKFVAFESDLSGKLEIYVRPFPNVNDKQWPVSTMGGSKPFWASSGREIFYLAPDGKLMAVPVDPTRGLEMGKPTALFDATPYFTGGVGRNVDVAPDGKRFVMVKNPASGQVGAAITVVVNWVDELKTRLK